MSTTAPLSKIGALNAPSTDAPSFARAAERPRVLMLIECSSGGTGRHVLDLSQSLIERGCEVHLLYSTGRIDRLFSDRLTAIAGLRHMAIPIRTAPHPSDAGAVWTIRKYLRSAGPFDIIHGHSSKGGALARLAAAGTGVPAFYTLHGLIMMDPCLPRWKWLFYLTIELILSLRTARIIAVSPEESRAATRLRLGRKRVLTIPNGVGASDLAPRIVARQVLGVRDDAIVIGFVGRLVEQKAPEVLLQGFATAVKAAPHSRLALVGAGPLENSMRQLADQLGINDKIIWLGERDARGVMAGFDLFAISSRKEGLPYVVLEAMSAGLPVVATTSCGVEILIQDGINGAVVPPDDSGAFGAALAQFVSNPDRIAACGRASLEAASSFTVDLMADRTLDAYLSVARGGQAS